MNRRLLFISNCYDYEIKDYYLLVIVTIMKCDISKENEYSLEAHRFQSLCALSFLLEIL